jgi:Arabinose efflux permease
MFETLRSRVLAVIFAGAILIAIDGSTVYPVFTSIRSSFGIDESAVVWVVNTEVLFLMLLTPVLARLSDIVGRKPVYLISAGLFLAGTVTAALSPSFTILLLGRALQGAGAAISVLAVAVIGDHFTENRGTILGVFGVIIGLAYAAGPAIAGFLVQYSWRWIFFLNIPLAAAVIILAWFLLPGDTHQKKTLPVSWWSMAFLGIAVIAFTAVVNGVAGSLLSPGFWLLAAILVLALILFWLAESRSEHPVLPVRILYTRNARITGITTIAGYLAGAGTYFLSSFALVAFGLSASDAAYMVLPFSLSALIATIIIGKLLDTTGPRSIMVTGGLIAASGMVLLSFSRDIWTFGGALVLIGAGSTAVTGNVLYYLMLGETGPADRASGQALISLLLNTGSLIGGSLVGAALMAGTGGAGNYRAVYFALAFVYAILAVLALCLRPSGRPPGANPGHSG